MNPLTLSRWQFGITTVYHFLFVPLTIGLSLLVASMQTAWRVTGRDDWRRLTRFFGSLLLINFAMGVVTGIVQEFQFGMNWSDYSRFVGDIFGAPLAMEGLVAFFLESTFLGLWIFGWDRLPPKLHLLTIWLAAIGTVVSSYFILAANSWMQHPVGYRINKTTNRAELTSIWKVLTNSTAIVTFWHTFFTSLLTGALFIVGVSAWHLLRRHQTAVFTKAAHLGVAVGFVAAVGVALSGHAQAQVMTRQQPMKMAAAEALWDTEKPAGFSLFAVGNVEHGRNDVNVVVPRALSVLSTNSTTGEVKGINDVQRELAARYGPGDYRPNIGLAYWSFRTMVGVGLLAGLFGFVGLVLMRRRKLAGNRWFLRAALLAVWLPFLGASIGWIFTEMARQPWVVYGVMPTSAAVSPRLTNVSVLISLVTFTLLYGFLAVIELRLLLRKLRKGVDEDDAPAAVAGGGATEPTTGRAAPALVY